MKRMVTLINQLASESGTTAALQAQADTANQAAEKYRKDNELLKQVGVIHTAHSGRKAFLHTVLFFILRIHVI